MDGYRLELNKKISPILLATLAMLTIIPAAPFVSVRAQPPTLMTDSAIYAGDPGSFFDVFVLMCDVNDLLAYDITVSYDTSILTAMAADFDTSTLVAGTPHFNVVASVSDPTGTVRYAMSFTGGYTQDVVGCLPAMIISFVVQQTGDSAIDINDDDIVIGPPPAFLMHDTVDGLFQAPPAVQLHRWDASVSPSDRQKFLSKGETMLTLVGTVRLTNQAVRGGYAFIVFDIVGPNGELTQAVSNTVLVNPGEIVDVSAPYEFAAVTGRYEIFATLWRGPSLDLFVQGDTLTGLHFFVHF